MAPFISFNTSFSVPSAAAESELRSLLDSIRAQHALAHGQHKRALLWLGKAASTYLAKHSNPGSISAGVVGCLSQVFKVLILPDNSSWSAIWETLGVVAESVTHSATENIQTNSAAVQLVISHLYDHLSLSSNRVIANLSGNELDLVEPALDAIEAVYVALDAEGARKKTLVKKLNKAEAQAYALLRLIGEKYAKCIATWFEDAASLELTAEQREELANLRTKYEKLSTKQSPFNFEYNLLDRQVEEELSPQVMSSPIGQVWSDTKLSLIRSMVSGAVQFDRELIQPLLDLAHKVTSAQDAAQMQVTMNAAQDARTAAQHLATLVAERKTALEEDEAQDTQFSIGHRAAKRYNINRNKFITRANRNNF